VLSFQKLRPLLFEWVPIMISVREWSVLYPVAILADLTLHIELCVTRKKSKRHWISGRLRRHIYLRLSGFRIHHESTKSISAQSSFNVLTDSICALASLPVLSRFKTKLKSLPIITSSHSKTFRWSKKFEKLYMVVLIWRLECGYG